MIEGAFLKLCQNLLSDAFFRAEIFGLFFNSPGDNEINIEKLNILWVTAKLSQNSGGHIKENRVAIISIGIDISRQAFKDS